MDTTRIIFLFLCATVLIYAILIYNRLVSLKHNVKKAWGNIDVLLKQRHDELPKLIATCKQYMQHEQETLRQVTEARSRVAKAQSRTDMPALDNEVVNINNIRIEQFPDLVIAHFFNFKAHRLLSFRKQEIQDINVQQLFNDSK